MRTIDEIKADIKKWDAAPMDEVRMFMLRSLRKELTDTIISGISLDRLEAICQAEKDGRCMVMPCKVGDAVYQICNDMIGRKYIRKTEMTVMFWAAYGNQFSKTVFLTREEAEAALRKEQSDER